MGWGRVKNGTDAGWKPENPKPREWWSCKCVETDHGSKVPMSCPPWWLNCPRCWMKRPY